MVEHILCTKHYRGGVYSLVKDEKSKPGQMRTRGGRDTVQGRNRGLGA